MVYKTEFFILSQNSPPNSRCFWDSTTFQLQRLFFSLQEAANAHVHGLAYTHAQAHTHTGEQCDTCN